MIQNKLATAILASFISLFCSAQYNFSDLDQELEARQKQLGKDLAVMVWKDTMVFKKELGEFNSKTQAPIGSCSKWLTAALVMQFVDEGKINLEDKITQWLPEYKKYFKNYITIRNCLSHITGIDDDGKKMKRDKFNSLEEEVNSFASRHIRANPGTDFWYGDIGMNIAGRVLEIVSKKRFDLLIKTKLLNPLGMRKTTFSTMDGSPVNPSAGGQSTVDDYMRFMVMLLNKGKYNGVQILSENAVDEMLRIHTNAIKIENVPKSATGFNYALGSWVMEEHEGKPIVFASPNFAGSWPIIDYCRGYAFLILAKTAVSEEKPIVYRELRSLVEEAIPCK